MQKTLIFYDKKKLDMSEFNNFNDVYRRRMLDLENQIDKCINKNEELQTWMDVYMPLRIQH